MAFRVLQNVLALAFIATLAVGCEPRENTPGLWLSGELVTTPVDDWSFSDEFPQIFLESRTWYWIPHSVTISCATHNGQLYLFTIYYQGGEFPEAKFWNRNVVRDSRVRLKIGSQLFEQRVALITDPAEREIALQAFERKYPLVKELLEKPESQRPPLYFLRVDPRGPVEDGETGEKYDGSLLQTLAAKLGERLVTCV